MQPVSPPLAEPLPLFAAASTSRPRFALRPFLPGHADAVAGRVFRQRLQVSFVAWFAGEEGEALVACLGEQLLHFGPSFCRGQVTAAGEVGGRQVMAGRADAGIRGVLQPAHRLLDVAFAVPLPRRSFGSRGRRVPSGSLSFRGKPMQAEHHETRCAWASTWPDSASGRSKLAASANRPASRALLPSTKLNQQINNLALRASCPCALYRSSAMRVFR